MQTPYQIFFDKDSGRLVYTTSERISSELAHILGTSPLKITVKGVGVYAKIEGNAVAGKDFLSERNHREGGAK